MTGPAASILFITSNRIGDAVLSTGVLEEARRRMPGARITIACGPLAAPIFRAVPDVERVIPLEKTPGRWRRLWGALRKDRYALAIDLRGSLITHFLSAKEKIVHRQSKIARHKVEELAAAMGAPAPLAPKIHLDAVAQAAAAALVPPGKTVLALGAGANFIGKRWPPDRFAELGRRLAGLGAAGPLLGATVALLGGPGDGEINAEIREALSAGFCEPVDCTGRLDLLGCAALLQRASLFVGNDSGLMHLSAAMGAPTLGLFGPSPEKVYGPWGPRARALRGPRSFEQIVEDVGGWIPNADYSLMEDLPVDSVEAAAREMLAEAGAWAKAAKAK